MSVREVITLLASCSALFTGLGGLVGYLLGRFNPGYYRFVFRAEREPDFDPIAIGIGQGITQGLTAGAFIGVLMVIVVAWSRSRSAGGGGSGSSPGEVLRSRLPSILVGGTAGFVVGSICAAIAAVADGPQSFLLPFAVYSTTLTLTGLIVGLVRSLPGLVGLVAAVILLFFAALIVGPRDGWIVLWVYLFCGSGVICGPVVGGLYYLFEPRRTPQRTGAV